MADRELRSAARQKGTYRRRWVTALLFFGLLIWLLWAFHGFTNSGMSRQIFNVYCFLALLYCLFLATARTADCISAERREGTLGLLFLTNLNSAEIIGGKLCSTALASAYGLMAIFPMLGLPLLMGGITFAHFARTVLALLVGILFGLAAGFLASVVCKRQSVAVALAIGFTVALAGGSFLAAAAAGSYVPTRPLASWLPVFSPMYTLYTADGARAFRANHYWVSVATVVGVALGCLGLTTLLLARTWRDRVGSVRVWHRLGSWWRAARIPFTSRAALRRRLLGINPLFWLASRESVSAPVFMGVIVILTLLTVYVTTPFFRHMAGRSEAAPVIGSVVAWLWTGLAIHALVLYYAAMTASQRLAEDKQAGALELILSTPISERTMARGLWLGYARKMLFPALVAVLVTGFFIWIMLVLMTLDPPGPSGGDLTNVTPGELFWSALLGRPLRGRVLEWQFGFILRIPLLVLLQLMLTWPTLGWVGRWLGLRMKHPGFAPMTSVALLYVPPILLFSLACYLADKFDLDRLPERQFLPLMMWVAFGIGSGHCAVLSAWAAHRLRHRLRAVAMSRYEPLPRWRWRLPSWRTVRRVAVGAAVSVVVMAAAIASYYGYQNWRGNRAWTQFQTALKQRGKSLDLSPLLPGPAPDDANFAHSPVFVRLLHKTNSEAKDLLEPVRSFAPAGSGAARNALIDWCGQSKSSLHPFTKRAGQRSGDGSATQRRDDAAALLQRLQSHRETLRELAAAAAKCDRYQISTNRDARTVIRPVEAQNVLLERLHLLFQVRACASLELGRTAEAAEDVLAGLRLARLARQLPDTRSVGRVQAMLMRSLQPLWEGLGQRHFTEQQLAAFQQELGDFNLLADYTNAVGRVVLAHIELWRAIPGSGGAAMVLPGAERAYGRMRARELQPRAWWFESCMELYNAGGRAIERVDCSAGVIHDTHWIDPDWLPLEASSELLLQGLYSACLPVGAAGTMAFALPDGSPAWVAFAQTSVNQAIVACALERFRLAKSAYPETLDQLVPAFLARIPHDSLSGRPLIYQPVGESSFILRGVGANGTDDRKATPSDDWLWTYSTNTPSAKK